ncbi:hypothetical protein [Bradyrhizobium sp. URHC0002]
MDSENDWLDRFESQRRTRPLVRAITAMGSDPDHHPSSAIGFAKARGWKDRETIETIERGAVVPTSTTTTGLTNTGVLDLVSLLGPTSCSGAVFSRAVGATFEGVTSITVPTVTTSPTGFAFVAQGAPIPIRQMSFSAPTSPPKKPVLVGS